MPTDDDDNGSVHGPVLDPEILVRVVSVKGWLRAKVGGGVELSRQAIPEQDIKGIRQHTLSLQRHVHTALVEMKRLGSAITHHSDWKADPVLARATAADLRSIQNLPAPKEMIVFADPLPLGDPLYPNDAHASAVRSPPPNNPPRYTWNALRDTIALKFSDIRHCTSGLPPTI